MHRFWVFTNTFLSFGYHVAALNFPRDPTITPAPILPKDLFERDIATCGWVRGNSANPLTCPQGYTCASKAGFTQKAWACCNDVECPGNWNVCENQGDELCANLDDETCSSIYGSILSCSGANPSCFRYAKSSSLGASSTWYSFACGQATTDVLVLASITGAGEKISSTSSNANANADPTIFGGSSPTETSSTSNSDGTSNGQSPSSPTSTSTSSNNTWKIIVACVVVGIVFIIAILIGGCCYWRSQNPRIQKLVNPSGPGSAEYQMTVKNWVNGLTPAAPPTDPSTFGGRTMYSGGMSENGRG